MNIKWDTSAYEKCCGFVSEYGSDMISLIGENSKTVLDLGCGSGELTSKLQDLGYEVTGLDASREFIQVAREKYPSITFIHGDATDFSFEEPYDTVFSNAVFHWIDREKQLQMLRCVYNALKPGGELIFEMGGVGNNEIIHHTLESVFAEHGHVYEMPFYFPSIGEYSTLLEIAGFRVVYAILFERPTPLIGKEGLKNWIEVFIKTPFGGLDSAEREKIVEEAVEQMSEQLRIDGTWYSDYVRLRIKAVRS